MKLSSRDFFEYYIIHPRSPNLDAKQKKIATAATIILGIFTLGISHLICRVFLYEDLSKKSVVSSEKVRDIAKNSISITNEEPKKKDLLFDFFHGDGKDVEGRTLDEILDWNDQIKESCHDYIQWLFPTIKPSIFNSRAPKLTQDLVEKMKADPVVIKNMQRAFDSMLKFYGLKYDESNQCVVKNSNFETRAASWCRLSDHNLLRITRILDSLNTFALHDQAKAFFDALTVIAEEYHLSQETLQYWQEAMQKK